ncbi:MAG: LmeA family phospholipid-binding protein [Limnothrix sp. RL_2_0]|nr:LmeA family phospholipid-binding protein [Limnothrix sp. RL_2_0]
MLKNLDSLGEQTINRIATAALASQMKEAESFSVKVKVDPQELSQGVVSSFAMAGKNVVTSEGFRASHLSLLIEQISVHPFKALMGNIQLRQPAVGNALLEVSPADLEDALQRKLRAMVQGSLIVENLSCDFIAPNMLQVRGVAVDRQNLEELLNLAVNFTVSYNVGAKAIAFERVERIDSDEKLNIFYVELQNILLDLLNLNSLMFTGLEFSVKSIRLVNGNFALMAIAKITSFPKAA